MSFPPPPKASYPKTPKEREPQSPIPTTLVDAANGKVPGDEASYILTSKLTRKHRADPNVVKFIDSFVRCKNIGEASAETGISPRVGYQWRHSVDIAAAIQALIDRSVIKYGFDASEIVQRAKEIVDFDPIEMQNPDGSFKDNLASIDPAARRNLKKLKVHNLYSKDKDMNGMTQKIIIGKVIEYEFYDKLKAVELVGREKDLFKNKSVVEHGVTKDMQSFLLESVRRGEEAVGAVGAPKANQVIDAVYTKEDDDGDFREGET